MGCDIHFFVEKISQRLKRQESLNEIIGTNEQFNMEWESADKWVPNRYYDKDDDPREFEISQNDRFYYSRDYGLFGILAGVRWVPEIGPISSPRGFPNDASEKTIIEYKSWGRDAHSASYFTLKELLDVDWSKYEYNGEFIKTIEKMSKLDENPKNVRCVFWFDN